MFLNAALQWTWSKYSIHMARSLAAVLLETILQSPWRSRFIECLLESIGKIIYSFIDINRNIMMCMMISGSAMIGGLGSYSPRESSLQHTDPWQLFYVYSNEVTGIIVHASLGVIPIGIH